MKLTLTSALLLANSAARDFKLKQENWVDPTPELASNTTAVEVEFFNDEPDDSPIANWHELFDAEKTVAELLDEYQPLKPSQDWFYYHPLGLGLVLGLWEPYMQRARNYDCQSEFFSFTISLIDLHMLTDLDFWIDFEDQWSLIWLCVTATNNLYNLWRVVDTCAD